MVLYTVRIPFFLDFEEHADSRSLVEMTTPVDNHPGSVTFLSQCSPNQTWAYAVLNFTQTFVDSEVLCTISNCTVTSVNKVNGTATNMYDFSNEFVKASGKITPFLG